jgi:DNA-binding NtrC family response regulator
MSTKSVLIVDDDVDWAETVLGYGFEEMGYTVRIVSDLKSARKELDRQVYSIVTVDMCLGEDRQTFEGQLVLDYIRDHCGQIPCIIISGSLPSPDMIFKMSRQYPMVPDAGYILKSKFNYDMLRELVDRACRAKEDMGTSGDAQEGREEGNVHTAGVASEESAQRHKYSVELHRRLRRILDTRFAEGELRTLCYDLDLDYDDLPGDRKADKARELVRHLERHDRISELVEIGKELRPDVPWGEMP